MSKRFVLIGIQGAGKSTQGTLLSHQLKLPYLSTGHIFREIAKEKTSLGRYVKETLNSGFLIPDDKAIEIVENYLKRKEYDNGYILDGYPRTIAQAKRFAKIIDKVISINLPEKDALWRLAGRNDSDRSDETIAGVKKRIQLFFDVTTPVLDFYEKLDKLITVDGTQPVKDVNEEILQQLGKQLIGERVEAWKRKKKTLIAIVGLPGSGKNEAALYFEKKDVPVVNFGKIINDYVDEHNLQQTESVHKKLRLEFREKYGIEAFAKLNETKIRNYLKENMIVVLEGMGSYQEKLYLESVFKKVNIVVICIWAHFNIRAARLVNRAYRGKLFGHDRDQNEVIDTNRGPTHALCDYMVLNNGTKEDLYYTLENIYREIYFQ